MSKIRSDTDPSKGLLRIGPCLPVLIYCTRRNEGYRSLPEAKTKDTQFLELTISVDSQAIGKSIAEQNIPHAVDLVSIQRGDEIIIPRGDIQLQVGDLVATLCECEYTDVVKELLGLKQDSSS